MDERKDIRNFFPSVRENVNLAEYTTFKIGGPADYFIEIKNKERLIKVVLWARDNNLPFFILSGGSNLLISDRGYRGLVIKLGKGEANFREDKIFCFGGNLLSEISSLSFKKGLSGLEWSAGIPGSIGGAVFGNAGAFGFSIEDIVLEIEALDIQKGEIKKLNNKDCLFGYRSSIFKENNFVILSATLIFKKKNRKEIEEKRNEFLKERKKKQPFGFYSAGSIFKNKKDVSAGSLIDECGLKGKRVGDVVVSEKHANFISNLGKGKGKEVFKLIRIIKEKVKKRFEIDLEEEIILLGDFMS